MRKALVLFLLAGLALAVVWAQAKDSIPDNCEYADGAYYHANQFPRYEAQSQRLVLVDWTSGQVVQEIAGDLPDTRILGWSEDCRYLATAIGAAESMDTVVWDVATPARIGSVPDAHLTPHHVTWGPHDYLVVETRSGAILWNVPANTQVTLTTSFNKFTARNFSRLRWDGKNNQLIANLANGGRVVYDLTSGQEVALVASNPNADFIPGITVDMGGKNYLCDVPGRSYYFDGYHDDGHSIFLRYNVEDHSIQIVLDDQDKRDEVLLVLETNVDIPSFTFRGWSANCRYAVASLGVPGKDATDTVVWDVVENKRVGVFSDARKIMHPLHFDPTGDALIVETRNGGYLWYLPTDTRTLLNSKVETALEGTSGIRSFYDIEWDVEKGQLLTVMVGARDVVTVFDGRTGQKLGTRPLNTLPSEVYSYSSPDLTALQTLKPMYTLPGKSGFGTGYPLYGVAHSDPATCQNGNVVQYDEAERALIFRDSANHTERTLESNLNFTSALDFSGDCRYAYGLVSIVSNADVPYDAAPVDDMFRDRKTRNLVIWDTQTDTRLHEFANPYRFETDAALVWSADSERALIRVTTGYYLWDATRNQAVLLVYAQDGSKINTYFEVYWDYQRGQVLVSGWSAVHAFDMLTGLERYRFTIANSGCGRWAYYGGCYFDVSSDNRLLSLYSLFSEAKWDLDTVKLLSSDPS